MSVFYNILNVRKYIQSVLDSGRLRKIVPGLQCSKDQRRAIERILLPAYERYVKEVSRADMAVSWETACLLYELASLTKSRKILDLGSGFSSYVLRSFAANVDYEVQVTSVDDNEYWLEKTKFFLESSKLSLERVLHWADFQEKNEDKFDFIFHDLGGMKIRATTVSYVLTLLENGGVVVLDDMHVPEYSRAVKSAIASLGLRYYTARRFTHDAFNRFAGVVVKL